MKKQLNLPIQISNEFSLKSVAAVQELIHHDMIYIYHLLKTGNCVELVAEGTNLKGDIRYRVVYKSFTLGYVSMGGFFKEYYESNPLLTAKIISMKKDKFRPVKELDIEVNLMRLKNVS